MGILGKVKRRYYIPGVEPRPFHGLVRRLTSRAVPAFPRTVQIQTQTGCNARCVFCPYKDSYKVVPSGRMDDRLFERIVDEIAEYGVTRRISPYLMNEPFLDPDLLRRARVIRDRVRRAKVVVTTNAGKLTPAIVDDLVRDNPFHAVYVSMQGIDKEPYEATMGGSLRYETTDGHVNYLIAQRDKHAPGLKIVVTMIKTNVIDAEKAVRHWRSKGVESKYTMLENRGGNTHSAFERINAGGTRVFKDCTRLFKHAYILFNGDMVLCCTDYFKTMVLGNVAESSIYEVWNGPRAVKIRRDFLRGDFSENPLCRDCYISTVD